MFQNNFFIIHSHFNYLIARLSGLIILISMTHLKIVELFINWKREQQHDRTNTRV